MTEVKHTPGPWEADGSLVYAPKEHSFGALYGASRDGRAPICDTGDGEYCQSLSPEADALLIAAAPDLLAVCKDIEGFLKRSGYDTALVRAAIAKAEGRT